MKKSSEARSPNNLRSEKNRDLFQELKIIENEWSLQKSNNQRRNSTVSSSGGSVLTSFNQLLENSPRELMSSLQSKISPPEAVSDAKNFGIAVEEVIMERRDALTSGRLKGRRLVFDSVKEANQVPLGWNYGVMIQEREVVMNESCGGNMTSSRSCTLSGSVFSEEQVEEEVVAEAGNAVERSSSGRPRCMVVAMAWLVILLFVIIFGLISMRCNGKSVHADLVPT